MKKIAILLPGPRREPVGGYKILYQYGDHLASVGWSVDFIYLTNDIVCNYRFHGLKGRIKANILSCLKYYNWYRFTSNNINHFVKKSFDKKILDQEFNRQLLKMMGKLSNDRSKDSDNQRVLKILERAGKEIYDILK